MNRRAQAVVMLLLGGAVVKAAVTGTYLRYVKHGLRPLLIIAGVLLLAAAVMTLYHDLRPGPDRPDHDHDHHEPRVGWLLLLPVLGLLLVAPPALGSYAAGRNGSILAAQNATPDYPPLPPGDPVPLTLLDYASRAVFDQGRSLAGRHLQLSGFLTPGPDGQPVLARIIVTCCAADGRPIKVGLAGNRPTGLPADAWVRVVGNYTPRTARDPINGAVVPYLRVTTWQAIPVPRQPYE